MTARAVDRLIGLGLAAFALVCLVEAYRIWNGWDGTGTMALIVGAIFAALAVLFVGFPAAEGASVAWPTRGEWFGMVGIGGPFAVYLAVVDRLGYVLSTWLLLAVVSRLIAPTRLPVILLWTGAVAVGSYVVFKRYLAMYLPAGVLGF